MAQIIYDELVAVQSKQNKKRSRKNSKNLKKPDITTLLGNNSDSSAIIFVSSCRRCADITTMLKHLNVNCVSLHSMMTQQQRIDSLSLFKSRRSNVLVATDVAGRGLDIPSVDLVLNADMPKMASDYIHRIGRTARAGKTGRALSLVTQYDVDLVKAVEEYSGITLELSNEINQENDILPILNEISKAKKEAQLQLMEEGFDEKLEVFIKRKKVQRKKLRLSIIQNQNNTNEDE
jgi:ATP-dependent RNA helicase DDX49/DBP8